MRELHVDFWTASASIAPVIGLTHYVLTRALYGVTAGLYRTLGNNFPDDAATLRDYLAMLSNISMASIAACITVMTWALFCLDFDHDPSGTRIAAIAVLGLSMASAIFLGVLTAQSAPKLGSIRYRTPDC
jgi:hypothetical protein